MIGSIAQQASQLNGSTTTLASISRQLADGAEQTSKRSNTVAAGAEELDNNISSVAAAMEQTTTNISMISTAQEIESLRSYLEIFKVRMGKRLNYTIEMDDALENLAFPSMLIQPIIENSIKHGLEPKIEGGRIYLKVERLGKDRLRWTIEDTGLGLSDTVKLGTGLSNVMERVESLYGRNGQVLFTQNYSVGLTVALEVSYG